MKQSTFERFARGASVLLLAVAFLGAPIYAQMGQSSKQGEKANGPEQIAGVMQDMAKLMGQMSSRMSQGTMSAVQRDQLVDQMKSLSKMMGEMSAMMMDGMSGMMGGNGRMMMMSSENQARMNQMRKQMAEMMGNSSMMSRK